MPEIKVTIYSTPFCGYCKIAKQYFDENSISYQDIDVSANENMQKEIEAKSGQRGVPVIIVEKDNQEEIVVGFQKEKLATLLNIK